MPEYKIILDYPDGQSNHKGPSVKEGRRVGVRRGSEDTVLLAPRTEERARNQEMQWLLEAGEGKTTNGPPRTSWRNTTLLTAHF